MMILAKSCTDGTCFSTPVRQIPRRRVWEKSKSAHVEIQTIVSWVFGSTTTLADCRNLIGPWYSPDPQGRQPLQVHIPSSLSSGTLDKRVFSRITVFNVVKMQTAMTMNTLGLGLGARPAMRSRVVAAKSAKAIVGTPVVGKPVQMAARRAAVTVRAGGNPEPIVQAPFQGIKDDLAARGPLYIDDFKQGVSPKSLVSIAPVSFKR